MPFPNLASHGAISSHARLLGWCPDSIDAGLEDIYMTELTCPICWRAVTVDDPTDLATVTCSGCQTQLEVVFDPRTQLFSLKQAST
jgi:hypothetical protein